MIWISLQCYVVKNKNQHMYFLTSGRRKEEGSRVVFGRVSEGGAGPHSPVLSDPTPFALLDLMPVLPPMLGDMTDNRLWVLLEYQLCFLV